MSATTKKLQKALSLGLVLLALGGCASHPKSGSALIPEQKEDQPSSVPVAKPDLRHEYRLGPDDLVRVDVFQVEGLSRKTRVNSNGEIALPLVGSVRVAGLSANEVEELLRNKLGERYLQNPQVSVAVEEFISQRVIVDGAVIKPGVYPLTGQMTLLQLFAIASGPTDLANIHEVRVFRVNASGKKDIISYDIDEIRRGSVKDPVLQGNDVVEIGEDFLKVVWKNIIETIRFSASTSIPIGR